MTTRSIDPQAGGRLPRYTSYPTAPHFRTDLGEATHRDWLRAIPSGTALSLYLHVPFCRDLCHYCGCHTTATRRYEPVAAYAALLKREIDRVAGQLGRRFPVAHIHWGGGTPTMLRASDLREIAALIAARFDVQDGAEVAVEIDPRNVTPDQVQALAAMGATRASLGVQSFDPAVQAAIGRVQSFETTNQVVAWLRFAGIEAVNLDLMYGLPHQTVANVLASVDRSLQLDPDRIALFGYAHVPWMKRHQTLIPECFLPDAEDRMAQSEAAARRLVAAGYVQVGLDHFARPDDPLASALRGGRLRRNFQGYTTDRAEALLGFGASAISRLPQGFVQNATAVPGYRERIEAGLLPTAKGYALTQDDRVRAEVIERLMCDLRVDLAEVCGRHDLDLTVFDAELARLDALSAEGLVTRRGAHVEVPDAARAAVRLVASVFDRNLGPDVAGGGHRPAEASTRSASFGTAAA